MNGYYKAELIRGPARDGRPWKTVDDVELATLSWVHWFNRRVESGGRSARSCSSRSRSRPGLTVVAVADGADRGHRADLGETLAVANRRELATGIGVTPQPVELGAA